MTRRALFIGFACALFIAGAGYVNDRVLELESFNNGHQIPIIVMGLLVVAVVAINPLLQRLRRPWAFAPAEIALVVILSVCASGISGRGLMEQFLQAMVMPFHWERVTPGWTTNRMISYAPPQTLVDPDPVDQVVNRFVTGSDSPTTPPASARAWLRLKWGQVPWRQWARPMATWLPMVFLVTLCSVCLALIVHRQWAHHELLQYPIAEFTSAIIDRAPGDFLAPVLRSRAFWIGFSACFLVRLNNGLYVWYPDYLVPVQMNFSLWPFAGRWPALGQVPWAWGLLRLQIFPLVSAFAFFLSSEISLTLGVSQIVWAAFAIPCVKMGVDLNTDYDIGGWQGWNRAGSYTAFTLLIIYSGRRYYGEKLWQALTVWRRVEHDVAVVWAWRLFVPGVVLLTWLVIRLGLAWPLAVATVGLMVMTYLIVARISAETGLFFIQPGWQPFGALIPFFGGYAMGPTGIVISAMVCGILCIDQSQALLPYLVNGLKTADRLRLRVSSVAGTTFIMYAAGVALAIVIVLLVSYDYGTPVGYGWSYQRVPTMPFRAMEPEYQQLKATDQLEASEALSSWERLSNIRPKERFLWAAGAGFVGVLALSLLRFRLSWWPLHPVLFLIWGTYPLCEMSHAFLMGWFAKVCCLRFGGARLVQKLRPLAIGIVAGEISGALVFMVAGAIYYFATGDKPQTYRFFPR